MEKMYHYMLIAVLAVLGLCILLSLIRAIVGPRTADRAMGINMISTMSILCLAVLSLLLKEAWLLDTALIYAALGFLAVLVLSVTRSAEGKHKKEEGQDD